MAKPGENGGSSPHLPLGSLLYILSMIPQELKGRLHLIQNVLKPGADLEGLAGGGGTGRG